jgi:hypothetical protein
MIIENYDSFVTSRHTGLQAPPLLAFMNLPPVNRILRIAFQ